VRAKLSCFLLISGKPHRGTSYTVMVEISKVIAFIPLPDQMFDDKNKNGSVMGTVNNQLYIHARELFWTR